MFKKRVIFLDISGWGLAAPGPSNLFTIANTPNLDFLIENYPFFELKVPTTNKITNLQNIMSSREIVDMESRLDFLIKGSSFSNNAVLNECIQKVIDSNAKLQVIVNVDHYGSLSFKIVQKLTEFLSKSNLKHEQIKFTFMIHGTENIDLKIKFILEAVEKIKLTRVAQVSGIGIIDEDSLNSTVRSAAEFFVNAKGKVVSKVSEVMEEMKSKRLFEYYLISKQNSNFEPIEDKDIILDLNTETNRFSEAFRKTVETAFKRQSTDKFYYNLVDLEKIHQNIILKDFLPENSLGKVVSQNQVYHSLISSKENAQFLLRSVNVTSNLLPGQEMVEVYELNASREQRIFFEKLNERVNQTKYGFVTAYLTTIYNAAFVGKMDETVASIEELDSQIAETVNVALHLDFNLVISSEVGLIEAIYNNNGEINEGSANPVPAIFVSKAFHKHLRGSGELKDLVPTLLNISGYEKPAQMEGVNLFNR